MATAEVNGVRLFYELQGTGAVPLVLVHGSWNSHHAWDLVVPRLAEAFRVLTYDRRGHSQSERPIGQESVREDADLAALLEHGSSCRRGWWRTLRRFDLATAGQRASWTFPGPHCARPLLSLLANDPGLARMLEDVQRKIKAVVTRIARRPHRCYRTVRRDRRARTWHLENAGA